MHDHELNSQEVEVLLNPNLGMIFNKKCAFFSISSQNSGLLVENNETKESSK